MKEIVIMSMQAVRKKLNPESQNYHFEIFGYDFIIDEAFRTWLIEINTNPCLEESSTLLKMLLPRMVDDALKLTIDQLFPKKCKNDTIETNISNYKVTGYEDNENMWEYLLQIGTVKVLANSKIATSNIYKVIKRNSMGGQMKTDNKKAMDYEQTE